VLTDKKSYHQRQGRGPSPFNSLPTRSDLWHCVT